jgi:hypothetical protein
MKAFNALLSILINGLVLAKVLKVLLYNSLIEDILLFKILV